MDFQDLVQKTIEEVEQLLREQQDSLRQLRFKAMSGQLRKVRDIRQTRKNIARILTFLNQQSDTTQVAA